MSAALHLAGPGDAAKLLPMVEAFHAETGVDTDQAMRRSAVAPLLEGSPHGAIWLIGPRAAPVGYIAIAFGWSLASGGLDGIIDEFFIRETVRGRGVGTEVLGALIGELEGGGVGALHLGMTDTRRSVRLFERLGFASREGHLVLTRRCGTPG